MLVRQQQTGSCARSIEEEVNGEMSFLEMTSGKTPIFLSSCDARALLSTGLHAQNAGKEEKTLLVNLDYCCLG
jgi:hypothetical protein